MSMIIKVVWVDTGKSEDVEVEGFTTTATAMLAHLKKSSMVAELDLCRPEAGWKIFPN